MSPTVEGREVQVLMGSPLPRRRVAAKSPVRSSRGAAGGDEGRNWWSRSRLGGRRGGADLKLDADGRKKGDDSLTDSRGRGEERRGKTVEGEGEGAEGIF